MTRRPHNPKVADRGLPEAPYQWIGAIPDPPVAECPITFLGHHGRMCIFAMPDGQIREERASEIPKLLKVDLFAGREGDNFLNYWRDHKGKPDLDSCARWFVCKCREKGLWNPERVIRGLGVWPAANAAAVLHRGSELWIYGPGGGPPNVVSVARAMRELDGPNAPIYTIEPITPAPEEPSSIAEGWRVYDTLLAWRWEAIGSEGLVGADLLAGWIIVALLGAVAPFRPHLLLYALWGLGKTKLMQLIEALLSALGSELIDDFTRAGLAGVQASKARPLLIDEAESSPDAGAFGHVEQALGMFRKMATGTGSTRKMGSKQGGTVTQTAVGAVMMAAVHPAKLSAADASRVAELKLLPLNEAESEGVPFKPLTDGELEAEINDARALSARLLGRALTQVRRYLADFSLLKRLFRDGGLDPRSADLVAALAAGRRVLLFDEALNHETAAEEVRLWAPLLVARTESDTQQNTGEACLMHLLAWPSGYRIGERIVPYGELVRRWMRRHTNSEDVTEFERTLREAGMVVEDRPVGGVAKPFLIVAYHSPVLTKIFAGTVWRDWRKSLKYLNQLDRDELGERFKTVPSNGRNFSWGFDRGLAIPLEPWFEPDGG